MELDRDKLLWIYRRMRQIREFENRLHEDFAAGLIPGFVHIYDGEEAIAVGVCAHLDDDDFITSTHRGHGHCIAKGVEINGMMAEIRGKAAGCCKGKGGSMHIADVDRGMLGANGIVGGGPPLACGAGLSGRIRGSRQATACFFGDGGSNQGTTAESLNLAAVWKLPMLFFLENNLYGMGSRFDRVRGGGADFYPGAATYGIDQAAVVDGMDVIAVQEATKVALDSIRAGNGPAFIEAKTFRFQGHSMADPSAYRESSEVVQWQEKDPIDNLAKLAIQYDIFKESDLEKIDKNFEGIKLRVRGNNENYQLHLRTKYTPAPWQYYSAEFNVTNEWKEVIIPFTTFKKSNFYQPGKFKSSNIKSIGIVAIGKDFEAEIDLGRIELY